MHLTIATSEHRAQKRRIPETKYETESRVLNLKISNPEADNEIKANLWLQEK